MSTDTPDGELPGWMNSLDTLDFRMINRLLKAGWYEGRVTYRRRIIESLEERALNTAHSLAERDRAVKMLAQLNQQTIDVTLALLKVTAQQRAAGSSDPGGNAAGDIHNHVHIEMSELERRACIEKILADGIANGFIVEGSDGDT